MSNRVGDLIAELPSGVLIGLIVIAAIALLMTGRSAWFARATRRLRGQRKLLQEDVGVLQSALVPSLPPRIGGVALSADYRPATGPAAGGDFHDVFDLGQGRLGVVVGDIAGHGPDALPSTAIVRYTIRAYLEAGMQPRSALRLTDRALAESLAGEFATAVAAIYDERSHRLTYACAGHPAPLLIGADAPVPVDALSSPPIGIGGLSGSRQTTVSVPPASTIWFFTDGLIESGIEGEMLGRAGLAALLRKPREAHELLDELHARSAKVSDDMTACRLQPQGADSAEALLVEELTLGPDDDPIAGEFLAACGVTGGEAKAAMLRLSIERAHEDEVLMRVSRLGAATEWQVGEASDERLEAASLPATLGS